MKVYTEVNYIWKDDKLVQTDSKSFDYEGEVELCHSNTKRVGNRYIGYKTVNIPHNHAIAEATGMTSETADKVSDTYKGSDLEKGITSGTAAIQAALDKAKKDNPNPNLNLQTPDKLYNKGRDLLHDAATNIKKICDRNRPKSELPNPNDYIPTGDTSNDNALLDEGPGSRATGSGIASNASGKSGKNKRVIREKNMPSLINQSVQKKLA